ncbi:MAG: hypothetical protein LRY37_01830 [Alkalibacterium thalassium]|nr:hypothetical protein [Alkalibacterium thalassium]
MSITPGAVNALLFSQKYFLISDENGQYEEVMYSSDHKLSQVRSKEELVIELSRIYTQENRSSIIWTFSVVVYLFLFLGLFFIVFVYAYLLYLMKDFTLPMIMTYRESVKLILNLLGGPTLLAVAYSFYRFNIFTMLALLIIGLMLQLFILYRQTKFQDEIYE